MLIKGLKSKIITPKEDLLNTLKTTLQGGKSPRGLKEGDILVIASKVVAITQGRVVQIKDQKAFQRLVKAESDQIFGGGQSSTVTLTVKNGIFIPWAGVDRSNTPEGTAVLWPKEPFKVAEKLQKELKKIYKLKKLGVLITDSFCAPLRKGVTGIALGYAGFKGVNDLRGHQDLHGNILKVSQQNMADMLASAAHLVMGESTEQTPFAIISNAPVTFTNAKIGPQGPLMPEQECLYFPLLKVDK